MSKSILKFYAVSPIHAGSGDSTATVDLPIQRERHTGYPIIHGSGIKGSMREHFRKFFIEKEELTKNRKYKFKDEKDQEKQIDVDAINFLFGADEQDWKNDKDNVPGAFSVSDAKILAFPMRSNVAPFVWVTCSAVLKRMMNDLEFVGVDNDIEDNLKNVKDDHAFVIIGNIAESQIILEDAVVNKETDPLNISYLSSNFTEIEKLLLISDQMFDYCMKCTDIQTNIKINSKTGTASDGALRYQEFLPADSVLYSVVYFTGNEGIDNQFKVETVKKYITDTIEGFIQVGGDQTVGKGICKIEWLEGGK